MIKNGIRVCKICEKEVIYNAVYDAFECLHCNIWTEETCGSVNCEWCKNRPERPRKEN
jgi:hypothetical protein